MRRASTVERGIGIPTTGLSSIRLQRIAWPRAALKVVSRPRMVPGLGTRPEVAKGSVSRQAIQASRPSVVISLSLRWPRSGTRTDSTAQ